MEQTMEERLVGKLRAVATGLQWDGYEEAPEVIRKAATALAAAEAEREEAEIVLKEERRIRDEWIARAETAEAERDHWKRGHDLLREAREAEVEQRYALEAERDRYKIEMGHLNTAAIAARMERDRLAAALRGLGYPSVDDPHDLCWCGPNTGDHHGVRCLAARAALHPQQEPSDG